MDGGGNLYGAASGGGPDNGAGTVFELAPGPSGLWTYEVLHSFSDTRKDGSAPNGGLVFDGAGNLYGTAGLGGAYDEGTVFELTPGSGGRGLTVLYDFGTRSGDGSSPRSGLAVDDFGDLYGIAGAVLFQLAPGSAGWTENALYAFCPPPCSSGSVPYAAPILDKSGNLYGTTEQGGYSNCGVVYEVKHTSGGGWKELVLYRFRCGNDGADPSGSLLFDSSGNLYGTAASGCIGHGGCSTVFKLTRKSSGWTETVLHKFLWDKNGAIPTGNIVFDKAGNLYGITIAGGTGYCYGGCGVVYKLAPQASGKWKYTVLYRFTGHDDGGQPAGGLVIDGKGNLYGGATQGGLYGGGVVFEVTP